MEESNGAALPREEDVKGREEEEAEEECKRKDSTEGVRVS